MYYVLNLNNMKEQDIKIKLLDKEAKIPTYGSIYSAGADLYANIKEDIIIKPNETEFISTGISLEIKEGLVGLIYARSSLGCKKGLAPANKVGVIDSDYRGEIIVCLHNHSNEEQIIKNHDRIAQIVFTPYVKATFIEDDLEDTERGSGGFGSTGTN